MDMDDPYQCDDGGLFVLAAEPELQHLLLRKRMLAQDTGAATRDVDQQNLPPLVGVVPGAGHARDGGGAEAAGLSPSLGRRAVWLHRSPPVLGLYAASMPVLFRCLA